MKYRKDCKNCKLKDSEGLCPFYSPEDENAKLKKDIKKIIDNWYPMRINERFGYKVRVIDGCIVDILKRIEEK